MPDFFRWNVSICMTSCHFTSVLARHTATLLAFFALAACLPAADDSATGAAQKHTLDVPAATVESAMKQLSRQTGVDILVPTKIVRGLRSKPVKGEHTAREALDILLEGTGLVAEQDAKSGILTARREKKTNDAARKTNDDSSALVPVRQNPLSNPTQGSIRGTVISAMTTEVLEGAEITLLPSGRRANTARDGTFNFGNVPEGDAKISVSYPGLTTQEITLAITPGRVSETTITLKDEDSNVVHLEAFVVQGAKEGMSKAIAMQKAADDLRVIAAADQFGDYAGNLGEYLQFLPGVAPGGGEDDYRNVSLRGMSPHLTNLTLDGTPMASASSSNLSRVVELESVSLSNVETIEVIKTLTPDQRATSTAGYINMVSKSAFDQTASSIRYRAFLHVPGDDALKRSKGVGHTAGGEMTLIRPNMELDLSLRAGKNLGFYIGARSYQSANHIERSSWTLQFDPASAGLPGDPAPSQWALRDERSLQTRRSASARIDWRISPRTKWSVSASWNTFDLKYRGNDLNFYWGSRPALSSTDAPQYTVSTRNIVSGTNPSTGADLGYINMLSSSRQKIDNTGSYSTMFENMLSGGGVLKAVLYYSRSDGKSRDAPGGFGGVYARMDGLRLETSDPGVILPDLSITRGGVPVDLDDITNYDRATTGNVYNFTSSDVRYGGDLTFMQKLPFKLSTTIKAGVLWDKTERDTDRRNARTSSLMSANNDNSAAFLAIKDDIASSAPGALGFPGHPAFMDVKKIRDLYPDAAPVSYSNTDRYAEFDEANTAAYLRVDFRPAEDWLIVAGVRHERLDGKSLNKLSFTEDPLDPDKLANTTGRFKWVHQFYSLNIKYTPARNHVFRAAATQSMGLPNYEDLLPDSVSYKSVAGDNNGSIVFSNPDLKPYEVVNLDLSYTWYFRKTGFATMSVFWKSFKNWIVDGTRSVNEGLRDELIASGKLTPVQIEEFLENWQDFNVITKFNIQDKGYYNGIELSAGETLTFLPRPFNTLGIQAGLTLIDVRPIRTNRVLDADNPVQNASLKEQARWSLETNAVPIVANIILSWRYRKLALQSSITHTGRTLRSATHYDIQYSDLPNYNDPNTPYIPERGLPAYKLALLRAEPRTKVDIRAEWRWKPYMRPYIQIRNLTNAQFRRTLNGNPTYWTEYSQPYYEIGIRGSF